MTERSQYRLRKVLAACFLVIASTTGTACLPTDCVNADITCSPVSGLLYAQAVRALDRNQIVQPENFAGVQAELQAQAALGSRGTALISTIPSTQTGAEKWTGSVLAPNGLIYGVPHNSNDLLVIDPNTNAASILPAGTSGTNKWISGELAPNGMIYGIPSSCNDVLVIDPNTSTATTVAAGTAGTDKWVGGVLAPNGLIYAIPRDSDDILVIDPQSNGSLCNSLITSGYWNKL